MKHLEATWGVAPRTGAVPLLHYERTMIKNRDVSQKRSG